MAQIFSLYMSLLTEKETVCIQKVAFKKIKTNGFRNALFFIVFVFVIFLCK